MTLFKHLLLASSVIVATAVPAAAAMLHVTYAGVVDTASFYADEVGFSQPLPSLVGRRFTETFTFDLAQGTVLRPPNAPNGDVLDATQIFAEPNFDGPYLGQATVTIAPVHLGTFGLAPTTYGFSGQFSSFLQIRADGTVTADVEAIFGNSLLSYNPITGVGDVQTLRLVRLGFPRADESTSIDMTVRPSSVVVAAVPLPPALPLMAFALLALGALGWRRSRAVSADDVIGNNGLVG